MIPHAEASAEQARVQALEEAAKVCEQRAGTGTYAESMGAYRILHSAAEAIRALRSRTPG